MLSLSYVILYGYACVHGDFHVLLPYRWLTRACDPHRHEEMSGGTCSVVLTTTHTRRFTMLHAMLYREMPIHTVRRSYFASVSFVDEQVGRVLTRLDELVRP